jgi:hypothetical protein
MHIPRSNQFKIDPYFSAANIQEEWGHETNFTSLLMYRDGEPVLVFLAVNPISFSIEIPNLL